MSEAHSCTHRRVKYGSFCGYGCNLENWCLNDLSPQGNVVASALTPGLCGVGAGEESDLTADERIQTGLWNLDSSNQSQSSRKPVFLG